MTPTRGDTCSRNQTLGALLWLAVRHSGLPLKLIDSSTGFHFPDHVVELLSQSDEDPRSVSALRQKMELYRRNGALLGLLLLLPADGCFPPHQQRRGESLGGCIMLGPN